MNKNNVFLCDYNPSKYKLNNIIAVHHNTLILSVYFIPTEPYRFLQFHIIAANYYKSKS